MHSMIKLKRIRRNSTSEKYNPQNRIPFLSLPVDLLERISSHLSTSTVALLAATCKYYAGYLKSIINSRKALCVDSRERIESNLLLVIREDDAAILRELVTKRIAENSAKIFNTIQDDFKYLLKNAPYSEQCSYFLIETLVCLYVSGNFHYPHESVLRVILNSDCVGDIPSLVILMRMYDFGQNYKVEIIQRLLRPEGREFLDKLITEGLITRADLIASPYFTADPLMRYLMKLLGSISPEEILDANAEVIGMFWDIIDYNCNFDYIEKMIKALICHIDAFLTTKLILHVLRKYKATTHREVFLGKWFDNIIEWISTKQEEEGIIFSEKIFLESAIIKILKEISLRSQDSEQLNELAKKLGSIDFCDIQSIIIQMIAII